MDQGLDLFGFLLDVLFQVIQMWLLLVAVQPTSGEKCGSKIGAPKHSQVDDLQPSGVPSSLIIPSLYLPIFPQFSYLNLSSHAIPKYALIFENPIRSQPLSLQTAVCWDDHLRSEIEQTLDEAWMSWAKNY